MSNIQFNKSGVPLIGYGSRGVYISTMGTPDQKPKNIATPQDNDPEKTTLEGNNISDWGSANNFPESADKIIPCRRRRSAGC